MFQIIPAVDIVNGQAVRLHQGKAGTETGYGNPLQAAQRFADQGAQWIHIVDLDAAFGRGSNAQIAHQIATEVKINVELCGGIRDDASLEAALGAGAARVNLGTVVVKNPEWTDRVISEYGEKIAVGLDVKDGQVAVSGWTEPGGDFFATLRRLDAAGCRRYVVTDVSRDGTMTGPNVDLLREVCQVTGSPVIASGGVSSLSDLEKLCRYASEGIEGAIVGKALYAGAFTLPQALEIAGANR